MYEDIRRGGYNAFFSTRVYLHHRSHDCRDFAAVVLAGRQNGRSLSWGLSLSVLIP